MNNVILQEEKEGITRDGENTAQFWSVLSSLGLYSFQPSLYFCEYYVIAFPEHVFEIISLSFAFSPPLPPFSLNRSTEQNFSY